MSRKIKPFRSHRHKVPKKVLQVRWLRKLYALQAWEGLRKAFAGEFPHYDRLRQYDLRHHAWTKMLEVPQASEATAEAVGGHIPGTTKKIYSHPRRDARHELVAHLEIPGLTRTA